MWKSDADWKSVCAFMAEEKAAAKATLEKPPVLDTPRPEDAAAAARWEREQELAGGAYCAAILKKDHPTPAEIHYIAKQALLWLY
jgi:hypothetical protein